MRRSGGAAGGIGAVGVRENDAVIGKGSVVVEERDGGAVTESVRKGSACACCQTCGRRSRPQVPGLEGALLIASGPPP